MGSVYRNKGEIPIPSDWHVDSSDGRVYTNYHDELSGKLRRVVLGYATSNGQMHVNDNFRMLHPDLWAENFGASDLVEYQLKCGLYTVLLKAAKTKGLYDAVQRSFGYERGNALMDYAMFSMLSRSNSAQLFNQTMSDHVLFSGKAHSDAWFSRLFEQEIDRNQIHRFKMDWLRRCCNRGQKKVWVAIDGSNNDCQATDSDLAEQGKSKSGNSFPLVSYIYAVDAEEGRPITYFVNEGNMVDSKAFIEMCTFLHDNGLEIQGIIIDRGFCSYDVVELIVRCGYEYVLMLKSDTHGHTAMYSAHGDDIRWNVRYTVSEDGLFGISESDQIIFATHPKHTACIALFFDGTNGSERSVALMRNILTTHDKLRDELAEGKRPTVPQSMAKYLKVRGEGKSCQLTIDYDSWQTDMNAKGFYSVASSQVMSPGQIRSIYQLRNAVEKQFTILKSMEGYGTTRAHFTPGIESRFAVCFIASILRAEWEIACKHAGLNACKMLVEMDRIKLQYLNDHRYHPVMNLSVRQKALLKEFRTSQAELESIAEDVNTRNSSREPSQVRLLPEEIAAKHRKAGRPLTTTSTPLLTTHHEKQISKETTPPESVEEKCHPGRPKGSKNKATLERERYEATHPESVPQKRPRGRPKGSKNKATLERERYEATHPESVPQKRPRGRPKGSLNKKTLRRLAQQSKLVAAVQEVEKRKRGRPRGSKNKAK